MREGSRRASKVFTEIYTQCRTKRHRRWRRRRGTLFQCRWDIAIASDRHMTCPRWIYLNIGITVDDNEHPLFCSLNGTINSYEGIFGLFLRCNIFLKPVSVYYAAASKTNGWGPANTKVMPQLFQQLWKYSSWHLSFGHCRLTGQRCRRCQKELARRCR